MNSEAQVRLDEILKKSPDTLNKDEIAFLRARRSYLKPSQLEEYASILNQTSAMEPVKKNAKKSPKAH